MSNELQQWGDLTWRVIKIILAYIILVITSYAMVEGLARPDDMAFVRNPGNNIDLQPDSFLVQLASWLIVFSCNVLSLIYLIFSHPKTKPQ